MADLSTQDMCSAALLPDEFAPGFEGRVMVLALINDRKEFHKRLHLLLEQRGIHHKGLHSSELLSSACDLKYEEFIQNHTLLPYYRAVSGTTSGNWKLPHSSPEYNKLYPFTKLPKQGAWFCHECAIEDMASQGFSYWRRSHQIPGVDWCSKHRGTSLRLLSDISAFEHQPHFYIDQGIPALYPSSASPEQGEVLQRFLDINLAILKIGYPMPRDVAVSLIQTYGAETGKYQTESSGMTSLNLHAKKMLPPEWLKSNFPELFTDSTQGNGIVSFPLKETSQFTLALALVFDSAEAALDQWLYSQQLYHCAIPPSNSRQAPRKPNLRKDLESSFSSNELASLELFFAGSSLSEACEKSGANQVRLEQMLRKIGVGARMQTTVALPFVHSALQTSNAI